jgi:anti-sigma B factor antagonist
VEISKILVARNADLGFIKVVGRGSFQNSSCLKAFYQQLLKEGIRRFYVDLDACTYLDSTFLGILLGLGLKLREATNGVLHILNASPRNLELLKNLGLDRLINIDGNSGSSNGSKGSGSSSNGPVTNGKGNGGNGSGDRVAAVKGLSEDQLQEIACPVPSRAEAAPTILEAHETLMMFDPRNVPKFKDVVEFLREDLGQPSAKN